MNLRNRILDLVPIDSVTVPGSGGRIGMMPCPGSTPMAMFGPGSADEVARDLAAIRRWGAGGVVSLVERHELVDLGVPDLGERLQATGLWWRHLPIRDVSVPSVRFERYWAYESPRLRRLLLRGERIVVHCWAGLGRTGMIAARLLVELGEDPEDAIRRVRAARPGTIQTTEQEAFVRRCAPPV